MVIQIKAPRALLPHLKIETVLPRKYGVPEVSLKKYYSLARAAALLRVSENKLFNNLQYSVTHHALYIGEDVLVHPDSLMLLLKSFCRSVIRRAKKAA